MIADGDDDLRFIYWGDLFLYQRASSAFFAIWLRFLAVSFLALAGPPFNPPSLPRAAPPNYEQVVLAFEHPLTNYPCPNLKWGTTCK